MFERRRIDKIFRHKTCGLVNIPYNILNGEESIYLQYRNSLEYTFTHEYITNLQNVYLRIKFPTWRPICHPCVTKEIPRVDINNVLVEFVLNKYNNIHIPRNIIEAITGTRKVMPSGVECIEMFANVWIHDITYNY